MSSYTSASLVSVAVLVGLSLTACGPAPEATQPAFNLANGQAVFTRVCAVCHQPNGQGVPGVFPPLAGSEIVDGDPRRLVRIVLAGLQGPITVHGQTFNSIMPGQAGVLNDQEIADALSYVRSSWGHTASPVTANEVAALRAENRATPWTWAELTIAK